MDTVLNGCPSSGPPLSYSSVQFASFRWYNRKVHSDVKRLGICGYTIYYKHYYGNKVFQESLLQKFTKIWVIKTSVVYSLILNYQFCACVMRVSGVPQLQVIHKKRLYGYKWHITFDRCVYHCLTEGRIWASLGKAGITKIAYDFRRDRTTSQLCSYCLLKVA